VPPTLKLGLPPLPSPEACSIYYSDGPLPDILRYV